MADEGADAPQGADAPEGANAPKALTFPKAPTPKGASRCSRHYVEAAGIGFDRRAAGFWLVPTAAQFSAQNYRRGASMSLHCTALKEAGIKMELELGSIAAGLRQP
jgi:hypothetical protein